MLSPVPAFVGGMPGGVELLVIFVVMLLLFGVPVALAVILGYRYVSGQSGSSATDERIEELESELETLQAQVDEVSSSQSPQQTVSQNGGESDEQ